MPGVKCKIDYARFRRDAFRFFAFSIFAFHAAAGRAARV